MSSHRSAPKKSPAMVLIVGGGVAGLAAAAVLSARGQAVTLIERERTWCAHSSGHNAAMFRHVEASAHLSALALRSASAYDRLCGPKWKDDAGGLYVGAPGGALRALIENATHVGLAHEVLSFADAQARTGWPLSGAQDEKALWVPSDGVIDIHQVADTLRRRAVEAGARMLFGRTVSAIRRGARGVEGVTLAGGAQIDGGAVIIAAGAWAAELGAACGAPLPLLPLRRHLVFLRDAKTGAAPAATRPHVWFVDDEFYFRPEGPGYLLSPCDEAPHPPCAPKTSEAALLLAAERVSARVPTLASLPVARHWACLRTFADDRDLVVGADPRCTGLFWFAGLGGHGMTLAAGAAEVLADRIASRGAAPPVFGVERLLNVGSGGHNVAA